MRNDTLLRLSFSALIAVLSGSACNGNAGGGESGETHFLCAATPDCLPHGDDLVCIGGECREIAAVSDPQSKVEGFAPDVRFDPAFVTEMDLNTCAPRQLSTVKDSRTGEPIVPCTMVEVRTRPGEGCAPERGRAAPSPSLEAAVREHLGCNASSTACNGVVLCELPEASNACHHDGPIAEIGWCYVDPSGNAGDDPSLVASCPVTEQRRFRFVDPEGRTPALDATVLIACWSTN